ncbi:hypothetical protein [Kineococcus rhizosphaerae]|uniref:Uncharacterized protein n=1 Tax=Kineococcus rhizosphaerae TaxID=559628 RepID=A0A2T0RB24_9ACTN|nr:hypothetical protein [Kineococcus rhizosphaerae]PRY18368.1 hypothetical protein CLV37_101613 [Kineococcus rhizosphaerae]
MRALRPTRLLSLDSGLWALDETQPVAAVLDRRTGRVERVVSWPEVPAEPVPAPWPPPRLLPDGPAFWTHPHGEAPLVRIGPGGVELAVWTHGLRLAAVGPDGVWCVPPPPPQDVVRSADGRPSWGLHPAQLLHVAPGGQPRRTTVDAPVRAAQAEESGFFLALDAEPWHLEPLGADLHEVVWSTRWFRVPWHAPIGDELRDVAEPVAHGPEPRTEDGRGTHSWLDPWNAGADRHGVRLEGARWGFGWRADAAAAAAGRLVVLTHTSDGEPSRRVDLGRGTTTSAALVGRGGSERLVVAVRRDEPGLLRPPVDLLTVQRSGDVTPLLRGGSVDVAEHVRPLAPRPLEAGSYVRQVLAANGRLGEFWRTDEGFSPLIEGMSAARARLVGDWPDTVLEWTFEHPDRPGVRLRRRTRLFDELGRITPPDTAAVEAVEDFQTGQVPAVEAAVGGFLDF